MNASNGKLLPSTITSLPSQWTAAVAGCLVLNAAAGDKVLLINQPENFCPFDNKTFMIRFRRANKLRGFRDKIELFYPTKVERRVALIFNRLCVVQRGNLIF